MPTLRDRGASMMNRLAAAAAAISGTYTRKAGGSVTLTDFVAGNSDYVKQPAPGEVPARLDFNTRSILGPAASLAIGGVAFEPAVGDRWTETIGGTAYTFEVMDSAEGRAFTWCDTGKTRLRIRLKRVP